MPPSSKDSQSQLRVHLTPNFPLASPILEEVPSPTSSSEERDMERNRPFEFLSKNASRNPFLHESEYSSNTSGVQGADSMNTARRIRGGERNDNPSSNRTVKKGPEKPIGLNLVTDFSRPHPNNHNNAPAPAFVDLKDLKKLSEEREKERSKQKIRDVFRRPLQGFHRLPDEPSVAEEGHVYLDTQERTSPKKRAQDEVSPSDRPIVIGYTIPADELCASQQDKSNELGSAGSYPTPSIVVTPAKEDGFWLTPSPDYRRPRSSIYSQPTPRIGYNESDIPPVPAIPAVHSVAKNVDTSSNLQKRQSTDTVFEEDTTPQLERRSRSYSEGTVKNARRQSATSFVNKHQSQGWWTYLLSPLLSRSNTVASRKTPTSAEAPPIPSVPTGSTSTEWWEEKEISSFSPDTPATTVASRGVDGSRGSDNLPVKESSERDIRHSAEYGSVSPMFPGGPVQGAAAEYYQASAYELFSGRPYFECINHVCSITPKDKINVTEGAAAVQPTDDSRALIEVDEPNETKDPFAGPSQPRHLSGSTIDDTPEDLFGTDKDIKTPSEIANGYPKNDSPTGDRALPEAQQPIPSYSPEEQKSSQTQPIQPAAGPPPVSIRFPSNTNSSQVLVQPEESGPYHFRGFSGNYAPVQSPEAPSPGMRRADERSGSIPLSDVRESPAPAYGSHDNNYPLPLRPDPYFISRREIANSVTERYRIEAHRQRLEREDQLGQRAGGLWRGRGPVSKKGCFGRPGREGRLKRRWYMVIAVFFLAIVVVAVALATTLTRKGDETPVQSQWLNLTGYPPMPTGIATIAGPEPQVQNSGCIKPSSLWSCALPKEQQEANKPYSANQPNFRVSIQFLNGTYPNSTVPVTVSSSTKIRARGLFEPSPPPPSIKDQTFLGNTTDRNSRPYAGEVTPFYITLLSPIKLPSSRLARRSSFPDLGAIIPPPEEAPDGTAAAANLYPLPESQPVRLYNRGQSNEHYGFYTYFDRSIFLDSSAPLDGGQGDQSPEDSNGGSSKEHARARCTWAQTRFLVQIWTQPTLAGMVLLSGSPSPPSNAQSTPTTSSTPISTPTPVNSSATDFTRPGSFPYPVTITIDRHGGAAKEKMVYCYGLDNEQRINSTEKKLEIENRGFGGTLVNPAPGIFNNTDVADSALIGRRDADIGPVDGGTGGCSCQWANWVSQA